MGARLHPQFLTNYLLRGQLIMNVNRNLIVGDIHGHYDKLMAALEAAGFSVQCGRPIRQRIGKSESFPVLQVPRQQI